MSHEFILRVEKQRERPDELAELPEVADLEEEEDELGVFESILFFANHYNICFLFQHM